MSNCRINMINFVRGVEPREPMDLVAPVLHQIELNKRYGLKNTFLLQYDAMINPAFTEPLLKNRDDLTEIGVWLEIVQPLVEKVGLTWRGRPGFSWDWHVNPGFLMSYTCRERELLIDEIMRYYKELFGEYPHSVGCWLIDAHSMQYMSEHYPVEAFAVCREQWGTDGYTLWGGYFNQGYYASRRNMLCPAQHPDKQIPVPVFRMLGFDPMDGYENMNPVDAPTCITMEPCWPCGQNADWTAWYLKNQTENEDLGFSYLQVGQENSFGWEKYGAALEMQVKQLLKLQDEGKIVFEKMSETGRWFRETYPVTPATVISALGDYKGRDRSSIWYDCRNYRANLYFEEGRLRIRDIHLFHEDYAEEFETEVCMDEVCTFDTLPLVEGYLCSDEKCRAGLYFDGITGIGEPVKDSDGILRVPAFSGDGTYTILFTENGIRISGGAMTLRYERSAEKAMHYPVRQVSDRRLSCEHKGFAYAVSLEKGQFRSDAGMLTICDDCGEINLRLIAGKTEK